MLQATPPSRDDAACIDPADAAAEVTRLSSFEFPGGSERGLSRIGQGAAVATSFTGPSRPAGTATISPGS